MATDAVNLSLAGLDVTRARINTITRNITNAQTDGYTKKTETPTTGQLGEVVLGPVQRVVNEVLLKSYRDTTGAANQLNSTVDLLQQLETAFGTPAANTSLSSLVANLQNAFEDLSVNPEKASLLSAVVDAASGVARNLNSLSTTVANASKDATTQLGQAITTINQTLVAIDHANKQISTHSAAEDVTDQEDERDRLLTQLAGLMDITTFDNPNGTKSVYTKDGKPLVDSTVASLSLGGATGLLWNSPPSAPASINIKSGTVGGLLTAQNTTFPAVQAQLDDIARALTVEFNAINIPLFNDGGGTPFALAAVNGYAGRIAVNNAVKATPSLIHDGSVGPVLAPGDTSVIDQAIALFDRTNVAFTASTGLPPTGSFIQVTTDFIAGQAAQRANAQSALDSEQALQQTIKNKISAATGVNIDDEVAQLQVLQNAYAANARVLDTSKQMFDTLLTVVQ
jgi:flagellar hook-associated protein 1 FlgK